MTLRVLGALALTAIAIPGPACADDQDVIDYREHIMKTMGEQVAAIDQILQQKVDPGNFNTHIQVLAIAASTAKKAFEPKVGGGRAKADVWSKWPDFAKRLDELTAATADLAKVAAAGGINAVKPKLQVALTCQGCHDLYREEKK